MPPAFPAANRSASSNDHLTRWALAGAFQTTTKRSPSLRDRDPVVRANRYTPARRFRILGRRVQRQRQLEVRLGELPTKRVGAHFEPNDMFSLANGRGEVVPAPPHRPDGLASKPSLAECPTSAVNGLGQRGMTDGLRRPETREELFGRDHARAVPDQKEQKLEGLRLDFEAPPATTELEHCPVNLEVVEFEYHDSTSEGAGSLLHFPWRSETPRQARVRDSVRGVKAAPFAPRFPPAR